MTAAEIALLPISRLRELFSYDPDTGVLRWREKPRKGVQIGAFVGSTDTKGRLRFEYKGKSFSVHAVAFAMYHGYWPKNQVDHKNRIKTDNRIANLREATNAQNSRNRQRIVGAAGYRGVTFHRGQYVSRIMVDGKSFHLGSFHNPLDAAIAYDIAARKYHGEFAITNS